MHQRNHLTNEKIRKKFDSQFDLVNYAISLATNMIHTGREGRVKSDTQNRATIILSEIINGKDQFDDVIVRPRREENQYSTADRHVQIIEEVDSEDGSAKDKERKKKKKKTIKE